MGNTVFTDAVPFTMDDILLSEQRCPHLSVLSMLSAETLNNFLHYKNNFKAFMLRPEIVGAGVRQIDPSKVFAIPVDLSQKKIKLEETGVYLLVHIQRTPVISGSENSNRFCFSSPSCLPPYCSSPSLDCSDSLSKGSELPRGGGDELPRWAHVLRDVFTPRGISMAFATNIGKPKHHFTQTGLLHNCNGIAKKVNATNIAAGRSGCDDKRKYDDINKDNSAASFYGEDEFDFRYSVHIFTGVKANQIVASVAVSYAYRIEKCLLENLEVVQRLFFNYKVSQNAAVVQNDNALCAPVGEIVGNTVMHSGLKLSLEYKRNLLLRILYCKDWWLSRSSTGTNGVLPLFSGKLSHDDLHSGRVGGFSGINSFQCHLSLHKNNSINTLTTSVSQCMPVLELQSTRTPHDESQEHLLDHPLCTQRVSSRQTQGTAQQQGSLSTSLATNTPGTNVSATSPRLPVITKLRITEALDARQGNDVSSVENDEVRMTEERLQKLRVTAPEATEIFPWLFVGGEVAAKDYDQLVSKSITAIVNTVAFSLDNMYDDHFLYLGLSISDSPDEPIFSLFPIVNQFVEEVRIKGGKTFIHCHQGVSRSCAFVIAYAMWHQGLCYDRAYEFVRARRTVCSPNAGFYVSLLLWEKHLSSPMLNKAYAYLPYPQYTFPFSFRPLLEFQGQQDTQADYDLRIINSFLRTVTFASDSYSVDPRFSYGLLLENFTPQSARRTKQSVCSFFFAGLECDAKTALRAKNDWDAFLKYNFYHGQKKLSSNNKGEVITFVPLPVINRPTECLTTLKELGRVVDERIFSPRHGMTSASRHPTPVFAHQSYLDFLVNNNNVFHNVVAKLEQERRIEATSSGRGEFRGEKLQYLPKLVTAGITQSAVPKQHGSAPTSRSATGSVASVRGMSPQLFSLPSSRQQKFVTSLTDSASNALLVAAQPSGMCSTPRTSYSNGVGRGVEIYEYPFTSPPLSGILDVADMDASRCYAIIVPASVFAAVTPRNHHVFLWFGCTCDVTEENAFHAYHKMLKSDKNVCLWDGSFLESPLEAVVYDGEEPDILILALES